MFLGASSWSTSRCELQTIKCCRDLSTCEKTAERQEQSPYGTGTYWLLPIGGANGSQHETAYCSTGTWLQVWKGQSPRASAHWRHGCQMLPDYMAKRRHKTLTACSFLSKDAGLHLLGRCEDSRPRHEGRGPLGGAQRHRVGARICCLVAFEYLRASGRRPMTAPKAKA